MALETPKIDIFQISPKRVLGDVISCLESKFDKKNLMGSVPNCRKEIANGIRWFQCKLKPPKKTRKENPFLCAVHIFLLGVPPSKLPYVCQLSVAGASSIFPSSFTKM